MGNKLICMLIGWLAFGPLAWANYSERVGYAYEPGKDRLIYTEEHREWIENGTVTRSTVTYRDASGEVIAAKSLDFAGDPTNPDFRLENTSNGHIEGARQEPEYCLVFFRKSDDHRYQEERVQVPRDAIVDGGFDRFIETNWQRLMGGEVFERPFLVPSFQKFIDFKIYLEKKNEAEVVFVMEPASVFLRMFGGQIEVTYDSRARALKRYRGISNIRDQRGENYDVVVVFDDPRIASR